MKLEKVIEGIVKKSKDKRVKTEVENIVGSILSDVEYWPVWYGNLDFSAKESTSTGMQKAQIADLENALISYVEGYDVAGDSRSVAHAIAERIVYWEDWYWDEAEQWQASQYAQDQQQDDEIYGSPYGTQS